VIHTPFARKLQPKLMLAKAQIARGGASRFRRAKVYQQLATHAELARSQQPQAYCAT